MRFVKPLDEVLIRELAASHDLLVTVEENVIAGGAGSGVNEYLSQQEILTPILNLGLPDQYIDHGSQNEQLAACGLDAAGIVSSIKSSSHFTEVTEIHAIKAKLN
jgi:1-deoxy-D-xylulose-5-phosphate synthase